MSWKDWDVWQKFPRGLRPETVDEILDEIDFLDESADYYRRALSTVKPQKISLPVKTSAKTLKKQLEEALENAYSEEERYAVLEHFIQKFMHGGCTRPVAVKRVLRLLRELGYEVRE